MSPHAPHFVWFAAPPSGPLRLRPGKTGSAALAGIELRELFRRLVAGGAGLASGWRGSRIVLSESSGGHFMTAGQINGRAV